MAFPPSHSLPRWSRIWESLLAISRKQAIVGAAVGVARVAGFLAGVLVARALGPPGFAAYTIAFTVYASLSQLSTFADTWLVTRWHPPHQRPSVGRTAWLVKLTLSLVALVVALLIAWLMPKALSTFGLGTTLLTIAVVAAGLNALSTTGATSFQAEGTFTTYALLIGGPSVLALLFTGVVYMEGWRTAPAFLLAIMLAYVPTTLIARRRLLGTAPAPFSPSLYKDAFRFGGWVTIGTLAYVAFQRIDVIIVASQVPAELLGAYGVAARFAMVGALFGSTLTIVLMPPGTQRNTWEVAPRRQTYVRESLVVGAGMSVILIVTAVAATPLVTRIFGSEYVSAVGPLRVLLISQIILILQMPFYFAFYALHGERWIAGLGMAQLAVAVTGGYALTRAFGLIGAAWSNVVTYSVGGLVVAAFHLSRRSVRSAES